MKSLNEWRLKEDIQPPGVDDTQPTDQDWQAYKYALSGQVGAAMKKMVAALQTQTLSTPARGLIMQDIIKALGLNASQVMRMMSNIGRAMKQVQ